MPDDMKDSLVVYFLICQIYTRLRGTKVYVCVCAHTHTHTCVHTLGFSGSTGGKEPTCQCRRRKRRRFGPWVRKIPWRKARQPTLVFLLGNPMDRGAWQAAVRSVAQSWTWLK